MNPSNNINVDYLVSLTGWPAYIFPEFDEPEGEIQVNLCEVNYNIKECMLIDKVVESISILTWKCMFSNVVCRVQVTYLKG